MGDEKVLYPIVSDFLKKELGCTKTECNAGTSHGRIDVLGFRERKSYFASQAEVVAVEVKSGTRFLNYIGQAVAYSLYSHRVYLALKKPNDNRITRDEFDIASRIGVGLLSISCEDEINLVATSNEFDPEHYRLLQVIDRLGYFECTFCRSYYPKNPSDIKVNKDEINSKENPGYPGKFNQAVAARRGLFTGSTSWRKITAMKKRIITISALSVRITAASFHRFFRKNILIVHDLQSGRLLFEGRIPVA